MSWLVLLVACDEPKVEDSAVVYTGPGIVHSAPASVAEGTPLTFMATVTDEDGVASVALYHRTAGDDAWTFAPMERGEADAWSVTLAPDELSAPGVEYYLKATDAGEVAATSNFPEEATRAPLRVDVRVQGQAFPFVEGFERDEGETSLQQLGWANAALGFRGEGWLPTPTQVHSGAGAVTHGAGGQSERTYEDWLISPAIDLSTATTAEVSWWERGSRVDLGNHRLMVSLGDRDPESGAWSPVVLPDGGDVLPAAPEGAWGSSARIDLSAYAGQPTVYLAWVYEGVNADSWWIDDIRVEPHQPALDADVVVSPAPIGPGEDGVLEVELVNDGLVDATDVAVRVSFPEGGATVDEGSVPVDVTAGGASSVPFTFNVDPSATDNAWLPVQIEVDLPSGTVTFEERVLIGLASTAHVELGLSEPGFVALTLGVGDPAAPTWSEEVYADDASGVFSFDADITAQRALLPALPGSARWFLTVESSTDARIDDFRITYDGVATVASALGRVDAGGATSILLPTPPSPTATATTTPAELSPGATGVTLDVTVTNEGAATTGAVWATLSSSDPDATVTNGDAVMLSASGLAAGEIARLDDAFLLDVAATHTDSSDLLLDLVLTDEVESFLVPVALPVPWPYLRVAAVTLEDDGGDGALDPGESADVEVTVANAGDRATSGTVRGTLALDPASAVAATVSTNSESYGTIGIRGVKTPLRPWSVQVDSGAAGDALDLVLSLSDTSRTWTLPFSLTLGEPPWQPLSTTDDAAADSLGGAVDLARARWRVIDGVLQLEVESHVPFDPSDAFLESWATSPGADWTFYRLVLQSGSVELQGYGTSGFVDISEPVVSFPDATTMRFDITLADLGLRMNSLSLGLAAGWCGPPEYYCDHAPDGWGYAYVDWNPGLFTTIDW